MEVGYKDKYYQNLARENQQIVKSVGYPYDLPDGDLRLIKFEENSNILGNYLNLNYKDNFRVVDFTFDIVEPILKFNFHWEDDEQFQLLEDSDNSIEQFWNKIMDKGYKPQIHDIIRIFFLNIQDRYYCGIVFFIDDNGIWSTDHATVPEPFYDLLQRLGLGEDFNRYIYQTLPAWFKRSKWPYTVTIPKKIK